MLRPSFEFLANQAPELANLSRCQVALFGFRVGVQHLEGLFARCPVVDHPKPTALPHAAGSPPDLPETARALDDRPLLGPQHQRDLELPISFVVEVPSERGCEDVRLDEPHLSNYTPLA